MNRWIKINSEWLIASKRERQLGTIVYIESKNGIVTTRKVSDFRGMNGNEYLYKTESLPTEKPVYDDQMYELDQDHYWELDGYNTYDYWYPDIEY